MVAEEVCFGLRTEGRTPDEIKPIYEALFLLERRISGVPFESETMARLKMRLDTRKK